jgi:hypothetical protein
MDSQLINSIQSFSLNPSQPSAKAAGKAPALFSSPLRKGTPGKDLGMQCDCNVSVSAQLYAIEGQSLLTGLQIEDDGCFCEGGCGKWYHIWLVSRAGLYIRFADGCLLGLIGSGAMDIIRRTT